MFSMTTMESSTTRPIATVIAPSVMMFNVMSNCFKTMSAMRSDNGIEMTAMIVDRKLRKNTKMMRMANRPPSNAFDNIVSTDSSIGCPWSSVIDTFAVSFSASKSFNTSLTALTTSTVFASCVFVTCTPMERSPFEREIDSSIPLSSIVASSLNATVGTVVGTFGGNADGVSVGTSVGTSGV